MKFTALNYKHERCTFEVKGRPIMTTHGVTLMQVRKGKYVVVYGMNVSSVFDYAQAAKDFGECIMHALQCAGKLNEGE
jgi:hypothetical protein